MTDLINNPSHYKTESGLEAIDVLEAFFENDPLGWQVGKYLLRAGKKEGSPTVQDLKKAEFYLKRKISRIEAAEKAEEQLKEFNESLSKAIDEMVKQSMAWPLPRYVFGLDTAEVEEPIEAEFEDIPDDFVPEAPREPKLGDKVKIIEAPWHSFKEGAIGEITQVQTMYYRVSVEEGTWGQLLKRDEFTLVPELADWELELLKPIEPSEPAPRLKVGDKVKISKNPTFGEDQTGWVSPKASGQIGTITGQSSHDPVNFDVTFEFEDKTFHQTIGEHSLARVFQFIEDVPVGVLVKDIDGDTWKVEDGELFISYTNEYPEDDEFEEGDEANSYRPFIEIIKEGN